MKTKSWASRPRYWAEKKSPLKKKTSHTLMFRWTAFSFFSPRSRIDDGIVGPLSKAFLQHMSHAIWTTLSQFEPDELWHCHLGICPCHSAGPSLLGALSRIWFGAPLPPLQSHLCNYWHKWIDLGPWWPGGPKQLLSSLMPRASPAVPSGKKKIHWWKNVVIQYIQIVSWPHSLGT